MHVALLAGATKQARDVSASWPSNYSNNATKVKDRHQHQPYVGIEYIIHTHTHTHNHSLTHAHIQCRCRICSISIHYVYDHTIIYALHEPFADFPDYMPAAPTHSLFGSSLAAPRSQKEAGAISSRRQRVSTVGKISLQNDAVLQEEEVEQAGCGSWMEGSGPIVQRILIDQRLGGADERGCCEADSSDEDDGSAGEWRLGAGLVRCENEVDASQYLRHGCIVHANWTQTSYRYFLLCMQEPSHAIPTEAENESTRGCSGYGHVFCSSYGSGIRI